MYKVYRYTTSIVEVEGKSFESAKSLLNALCTYVQRFQDWNHKDYSISIISHRFVRSTMKIAVLVSLFAGAAAFAPSKTASQSTALNSYEKELGAQQPLGFWVRGVA